MEFTFGAMELSPKSEATALQAVNNRTRTYGLALSSQEALVLVEEKNKLLKAMGRIELQNDVIAKLAERFSSSAYISSWNYRETLGELVRIFYYCRSEFALDESDDDLIDWMADTFELPCQGSLELLEGRALDEKLRRYKGQDTDDQLPEAEPEEEQDEQ